MRIISYNTYKCSQAKIDHILAIDADLYVFPECFSKDHIVLPEAYDMLWCGDEDLTEKGLGVIWKKRLDVHVIPEYKKIKHILALQILSVDSLHKSVSRISSRNGTRRTAGHIHPEVRI